MEKNILLRRGDVQGLQQKKISSGPPGVLEKIVFSVTQEDDMTQPVWTPENFVLHKPEKIRPTSEKNLGWYVQIKLKLIEKEIKTI